MAVEGDKLFEPKEEVSLEPLEMTNAKQMEKPK